MIENDKEMIEMLDGIYSDILENYTNNDKLYEYFKLKFTKEMDEFKKMKLENKHKWFIKNYMI